VKPANLSLYRHGAGIDDVAVSGLLDQIEIALAVTPFTNCLTKQAKGMLK
jgi:hypothetical protein